MSIAVDTSVLIWGIKKQATAGQESMITKAERLFARFAEDRTKVLIPAQSFAEFLVRFDDDKKRRSSYDAIRRTFIIAPFDAKAAYEAAIIEANRSLFDQLHNEYDLRKQIIKADVAVLAAAIAMGATRIYTGDKRHLPKLAQGKIIVDILSDATETVGQKELFED